jgi:hypothetical protein
MLLTPALTQEVIIESLKDLDIIVHSILQNEVGICVRFFDFLHRAYLNANPVTAAGSRGAAKAFLRQGGPVPRVSRRYLPTA